MPIPVIIPIVIGAYGIAKGASDKKKARDKYYAEAQSELFKQRANAVSQTDEQRQEALKLIAKQYAVNAINENLSVQKQAQEMADQKVKKDQTIAVVTISVAVVLISIELLRTK
jgi:hypothetical protein